MSFTAIQTAGMMLHFFVHEHEIDINFINTMQVKRFVIELWLINLLINTFTQLMFAGISTRISDDFRFRLFIQFFKLSLF